MPIDPQITPVPSAGATGQTQISQIIDKKRYGLMILNYVVISNHIHVLVQDTNGLNVIPRSIQLVAGRTGQEFNNWKKQKGAFWTQSIATGRRTLVEAIKKQMRSFAIGRRVRKKVEIFELRESQSPYKALFDTEKIDIAGKNLWFWNE